MRQISIPKEQICVLNNLTKMIEKKIGIDNYLISEQNVADKYGVDVDEVILKEKEAIPLEVESSNKLRRIKILNNLYSKGLDFYKESEGGLKSDFTDALIVKDGKMLFGLRSKDSKVEPNKWGLLGAGHLERFLSPEKNVLKEIKEETGLDIIEYKLINTKHLSGGRKIYYFLCIPADGEVVINQQEHQNYKWMNIQEIEKMDAKDFMFDLKDYLLKMLGKK